MAKNKVKVKGSSKDDSVQVGQMYELVAGDVFVGNVFIVIKAATRQYNMIDLTDGMPLTTLKNNINNVFGIVGRKGFKRVKKVTIKSRG